MTKELFNQCQKGYRKKVSGVLRSKNNPLFPLRRLCFCSECKTALTGSCSTGRGNIKYPYYHHHRQECPKAEFIPKKILEQAFVEYLNKITPDTKYEKIFKAIVTDIWKTNYKKFDEGNVKIRSEIEKLEQERQKVFDLHRTGVYNDGDFLEQKNLLAQKIRHNEQLIQDNRIEEFNMDEALEYCFKFVRETATTWVRLKNKNYNHLMRFQNQIFPEKINYDGKKFGTTKTSLVYKLGEEFDGDKSHLVTLLGVAPSFQD